MCKPHCVGNGGCIAIGHRLGSLTQRQKETFTHVTNSIVYPPENTASSFIDPELEYRATTPPSTQAPALTPSLAPTPALTPSLAPTPARSLIVPPPIAVGPQANPKMTRQMSNIWMDHYSGTPGLKERVKGGRSAQTDIALSHRFLLVYWDDDEQPASIRVVQGGDDWPKWNLAADPVVHASLASSAPLEAIDIYEFKYSTWAQVPLDYRFIVKTDAPIFIRRRNIHPIDFEEQRQRFLAPIDPPHIRYKMRDERRDVRERLKTIRKADTVSDSGSDVEVVTPRRPINKRRRINGLNIKVETDDPALLPYTPGPLSLSSLSPILISSSPESPSLDRTPSPSPNLAAPSEPDNLSPRHWSFPADPWPGKQPTRDIYRGFLAIDKMAHTDPSLTLPKRFEAVFHTPYVKSTYHDARKRWSLATQQQRDDALNAGITTRGRWSYFARGVPLK
jgi:hypothetical protein